MEKTQLQTQDTTDLRKPKGSTRPPQGNDAKAKPLQTQQIKFVIEEKKIRDLSFKSVKNSIYIYNNNLLFFIKTSV